MAYDGIYLWIRNKLRDSVVGIENSSFDLEIKSVLRSVLSKSPYTYDTLLPNDVDAVDEAVGLMVAVRIHAELVTGGVSSSLTAENTDDVKRNFAPSDTMKAEWMAQAKKALLGTSFGTIFSFSGGSAFGVNGPSRNRCEVRDRAVYPGCDRYC